MTLTNPPTISGNPFITGNLALYATTINLASTGNTLNNSINSLSGTLTSSYATITNLASTGSTLDTKVNNLSGTLTGNYYLKSNPSGFITGVDLSSYATITNLASTGSTLNTNINNLSGYINSTSSNIVFTTGNQIKSGRLIIGSSEAGVVDPNSPYTLSVQSNYNNTWLEILNDSGHNQGVFFGINGNDFEQYNYQGGDILFFTSENISDGLVRLTIKNNGKVGIGTNSPSEKLEVVGNLKVSNSGFFASGIKVGNNSIYITENRIDGGYLSNSNLTDGLLGVQYSGYYDRDPTWFNTASVKPIITGLTLTGAGETANGTYVSSNYLNQGTYLFDVIPDIGLNNAGNYITFNPNNQITGERYWGLYVTSMGEIFYKSYDLINWTDMAGETQYAPKLQSSNTINSENSTYFYANRSVMNGTSWEWVGYFRPQNTSNHSFNMYADENAYFWIGDKALNGYTTGNADMFSSEYIQVTVTGLALVSGVNYPVRMQWGHPANPTNAGLNLGYNDGINASANFSGLFFHGSQGKSFYIDAISGDAYFAGNVKANNLVYNTGDQTISGSKTFANSQVNISGSSLNLGDFIELGTPVTVTQDNNTETQVIDIIDSSVQITRGSHYGIYNPDQENAWNGNGPSYTEWNADGWSDLSNLVDRTYYDLYYVPQLNNQIGNYIVGQELIMHDTFNDKYYKFYFTNWMGGGSTSWNNDGDATPPITYAGFEYTRTRIISTSYAEINGSNIGGYLDLKNRLFINGTGVLLSGEAGQVSDSVVQTSGTQTISGSKTFTAATTFNSGVYFNNNITVAQTGIFSSMDVSVDDMSISGLNLTLTSGNLILAGPTGIPSTTGASGVKGTIVWNTGFLYVCTNTNSWRRAALSTW